MDGRTILKWILKESSVCRLVRLLEGLCEHFNEPSGKVGSLGPTGRLLDIFCGVSEIQ